MKPVYSALRCKGWENVGYIDDTYLQGSSFHECQTSIVNTISLFKELGFDMNEEKSELIPKQIVSFLGFLLNSREMTIKLTESKALKIREKSKKILETHTPSIR